jgi:hypothetical protein
MLKFKANQNGQEDGLSQPNAKRQKEQYWKKSVCAAPKRRRSLMDDVSCPGIETDRW